MRKYNCKRLIVMMIVVLAMVCLTATTAFAAAVSYTHLGSAAFKLPYSQELEEQYLEGTLLNDLSMKDSKAFRREIEKICKEVF